MDLRIEKVEFSNNLLMSLSPRYPAQIAHGSYGNFELRLIPDIVGNIDAVCYIFTNMGMFEYPVCLQFHYYLQITAVGVPNEYNLSSLLNIRIPRGGEYTHTISLFNPSWDKKLRIHSVGSLDNSILKVVAHHSDNGSFIHPV